MQNPALPIDLFRLHTMGHMAAKRYPSHTSFPELWHDCEELRACLKGSPEAELPCEIVPQDAIYNDASRSVPVIFSQPECGKIDFWHVLSTIPVPYADSPSTFSGNEFSASAPPRFCIKWPGYSFWWCELPLHLPPDSSIALVAGHVVNEFLRNPPSMRNAEEAKGWELDNFQLADIYLLRAYQLPLSQRMTQFALSVVRRLRTEPVNSPWSADSLTDLDTDSGY